MQKTKGASFFKAHKKGVIIGAVLVLAAAIGCGVWYYAGHNSAEPVYVYPFNYIGMTEYWGDSQESHGPVSTDKIQTVFLSETQTVTEILVSQGDTVKKGDLLMSFDTTLSDLALEKKRLDVEKAKLQIQAAEDELQRIRNMKPMVIPAPDSDEGEEEENLGIALKGDYQVSTQKAYDGSAAGKALICWLSSSAGIDSTLFEQLRQTAETYQEYNAEAEKENAGGEAPDTAEGSAPETGETPSPEAPETPEIPDGPVDLTVNEFHVVIKVTHKNMSLGSRETWQGLKVKRNASGGFSFQLENASVSDHMMVDTGAGEEVDEPQIDFGSGFTAAQIAEMRQEQEKKIKDLQFQAKMVEAEYKIMLTEMDDGNVYAEIDGEVVSLLTEEEAKMTMQPILKVSGGGGFYVEGFVSELEKDKMVIGQEVTVNDWNTGMTYPGTISSLGDFPTSDGYYNGMGNPTASYYPFYVFVDGSADLQQGRYVSVTYSSGTSENGVYLENPFIRTEKGKSYIYVLGADSRLEKRFVTTGKALWGSYTEILEGLTAEDLIAFPYGKNVKPGVKAQEGDMSNLYG